MEAEFQADFKRYAPQFKAENVKFYKGNLAEADQIDDLWKRLTTEHGPIHMLINNAAVCFGRKFLDQPLHLFKLSMDINFMAYVHLTRRFLE